MAFTVFLVIDDDFEYDFFVVVLAYNNMFLPTCLC